MERAAREKDKKLRRFRARRIKCPLLLPYSKKWAMFGAVASEVTKPMRPFSVLHSVPDRRGEARRHVVRSFVAAAAVGPLHNCLIAQKGKSINCTQFMIHIRIHSDV